MPLFPDHEPRGERCRALNEEVFASGLPPVWAVLAALWDARRTRAADTLARARRDLDRARADEHQAQAEALRLHECALVLEREWHRAMARREARGLDIHHARTAQAYREAVLARRAADLQAVSGITEHARRALFQARQRYAEIARKREKLRLLRQHVDVAAQA